MDFLELAAQNEKRAWEIIKDTNTVDIWASIGAKVNLIGSLKTGLLMKHLDIDFHIYSSPLCISDSFAAMAKLAENKAIKQIQYINLMDTDEKCIEWHAWYEDCDGKRWQIDMIHIESGSQYDGYMEKVADRITKVLTPELKQTILRIKYDTPDTDNVMGIEYYQAAIRDGVKNYTEFQEWREKNPVKGVVDWIP